MINDFTLDLKGRDGRDGEARLYFEAPEVGALGWGIGDAAIKSVEIRLANNLKASALITIEVAGRVKLTVEASLLLDRGLNIPYPILVARTDVIDVYAHGAERAHIENVLTVTLRGKVVQDPQSPTTT